jgi:hypothetical protein
MMSASPGRVRPKATDRYRPRPRERLCPALPHERLHQHDVHHRGLVDHQEVAFERIILAPLETTALWIDSQKPVDGLDLEAGRRVIRLAARAQLAESNHPSPRKRRIEKTDEQA